MILNYSLIKYSLIFILSITIYGCTILSGHYIANNIEPLKIYPFMDNTKRELNNAIQCLIEKESEYKAPSSFNTIHNYSDLSTPEARRWNSDSVNFHFFISSQGDDIVFWTRFVGHEQNWNVKKYRYGIACELSLKAIYVNGMTISAKDFKNEKEIEENKYSKLFESEILPKINSYLKKGDCKYSPAH